MGSVGTERFKELSPAGTPEGNVVMSFSFDSYQLEEDELQRGGQAKGVLTFMEPVSEDPEPQDRYHGIYFAMLLAGVGFLLPYNSFITDVDYLLIYSCLRVVFIPLFIMCVYPNGKPAFGHPAWPCVFSLLMGITNGYFGSVPMILAAGKVSPEQRELAGNTMTVSYMTGLTLGSAVAYFAYSLTSTSHSSCFYTETSNGSFLGGY